MIWQSTALCYNMLHLQALKQCMLWNGMFVWLDYRSQDYFQLDRAIMQLHEVGPFILFPTHTATLMTGTYCENAYA